MIDVHLAIEPERPQVSRKTESSAIKTVLRKAGSERGYPLADPAALLLGVAPTVRLHPDRLRSGLRAGPWPGRGPRGASPVRLHGDGLAGHLELLLKGLRIGTGMGVRQAGTGPPTVSAYRRRPAASRGTRCRARPMTGETAARRSRWSASSSSSGRSARCRWCAFGGTAWSSPRFRGDARPPVPPFGGPATVATLTPMSGLSASAVGLDRAPVGYRRRGFLRPKVSSSARRRRRHWEREYEAALTYWWITD